MAAESGKPDCGSDALAKLTAAYALDLHRACGSTPIDDCAEILKGPVRKEHEPKFDRWATECD